MNDYNEKYMVKTQADLTRRTEKNDPEMPIEVFWEYPECTMRYTSVDIVSSGWCMGTDGSKFHLNIENPLENSYINRMLEPCLRWMEAHGAEQDDSIKWKFWDLMKHANLERVNKD